MARRKRRAEETPIELQMAPMIDIIFQLLIFFMCATQFKSLEGKLYAHLPKDKGLEATPVINPMLDEVRIFLIFDENAPEMSRIRIGKTEKIPDWDALFRSVRSHYENLKITQGSKKEADKVPFIIDCEDKIPFQSVVNVLNICDKAEIANVEFAAKTPVDERIK